MHSLMTRFSHQALILALLLFSLPAVAKPGPEETIEKTFEDALAAMLEHADVIGDDPDIARDLMDEILAPRVHFELMARLVLGRHWRDATPEQQERFAEAFRRGVTRTYARLLSDNIDAAVRLTRDNDNILRIESVSEPDEHDRVTVRTRLQFDGPDIPVHYRLIKRDDGSWQAYDVVVENISFVTNYRQEYGSAIRRDGIEALIERLEERGARPLHD